MVFDTVLIKGDDSTHFGLLHFWVIKILSIEEFKIIQTDIPILVKTDLI